MKVQCSCGRVFKDEPWLSAEAQFAVHTAILAPAGRLSSKEHKKVETKQKPKSASSSRKL